MECILKQMGNNWYFDSYDIRKFAPDEIATFLDIGMNVGSMTLMARLLMPKAKVIGMEPCKEIFEIAKERIMCWGKKDANIYNVALGNGSPLHFEKSSHSGMHRFFTQEERVKRGIPDEYDVDSKTLKQIYWQNIRY